MDGWGFSGFSEVPIYDAQTSERDFAFDDPRGAPHSALALEGMKPEPPLGADGKKLIRRLASSFAQCTEHAQAYGACIKIHFEGVRKGDCEAEFKALQTCFRTALTKARAKGQ